MSGAPDARRPAAGRQGRRSHRLPLLLYVVAIGTVVAALPTSLRPPQQPGSTAAELSPDAPPDDSADAIVSALRRGTSGTAGAGPGEGDNLGAPATSGASPAPVAASVPPPRFCPNGFGDPPRQVESLYSAPCAGSWRGDNGGSTWKNVTATEIRVGYIDNGGADQGMTIGDDEGPLIGDSPAEGESDAYRTWRVYQQYFNQNFQFWGRHLRFVVPQLSEDTEAGFRAGVAELDERWKVFAVNSTAEAALSESARRKLVGLGGWGWDRRVYDDNQPYLFAWNADGTSLLEFSAEYICKKLAGKTADFGGAAEQGTTRRFGMVLSDWSNWGKGAGFRLPPLVKQQCGIDMVVLSHDNDSWGQFVATSIARLRAEGVTTVVVDLDSATLTALLGQADSQSYFPEWFVPGTWINDVSTTVHFLQFSRAQWAHAFGLSGRVMEQREQDRDCNRAYKLIDPNNDASEGHGGAGGCKAFRDLLQIANGIQMAGPNLTPEAFRQGLWNMGKRVNDPPWSVGGGFAPGDISYGDDVSEIWWDNTVTGPGMGAGGAYRYVDCGRRYRIGEITSDTSRLFNPEGSCVIAPGQA